MPEEEKMVNTREIEKIKKYIDDVITSKSIPFSSLKKIPLRGDEMGLEEKDRVVMCHIKDNPGINKEQVVDAFKNKQGYSRRPVFKIIKRLEKNGWIVIRPDTSNRQIHHLFINNENGLVLLIQDIDSFKQAYFILMNNLNSFLRDKGVIFSGLLGLKENLRLVDAILTPFKFILNLYVIFDFLPQENFVDNELLHRRFALIYSTIKEIQIKLYENFFKESKIKLEEEFFINTYLYDNLGFSNNILHSYLFGSNQENIKAMLVTFNKYELGESAEKLMDCLWKLISPVFHIVYPRHSRANPDLFKDWRNIVNFPDFDATTQLLAYRNIIKDSS